MSALCVVAVAGCGRYGFSDPGVVSKVMTFGDLGDDLPRAIVASADGNVIVGGQFRGTIDFGCSPLPSAGGGDGFVVELTPQLTCVRTWAIGGMGDDLVTDVAEDRAGSLIAVGEIRQTATMTSGGNLTAMFTRDIFLTKMTPTWQNIWSHQLPGNDSDQSYELINKVGAESNGDLHLFGRIWGSVTFGWGGVTQMFSDNGWGDAFVAKVTSDGQYVTADMWGGGGSEQTYGMAIDAQDNLYLGGNYRGTADFDPGPTTLDYSGNFDGFVVKRNPDNTLAWADVNQGGGWRPYEGIALKSGGQVAAVQNDLFTLTPSIVLKTMAINTADGSIAWSRDVPAPSGAYALSITTDLDGNVYVAGRFADTVDFAPTSGGDMRVSQGGADCFLQRYDADGTLAWTITFGGTGDDQIDDLVALAPNDLVLVGRFQADVDFGTETMHALRHAKGGTDIFVRRLHVQ